MALMLRIGKSTCHNSFILRFEEFSQIRRGVVDDLLWPLGDWPDRLGPTGAIGVEDGMPRLGGLHDAPGMEGETMEEYRVAGSG